MGNSEAHTMREQFEQRWQWRIPSSCTAGVHRRGSQRIEQTASSAQHTTSRGERCAHGHTAVCFTASAVAVELAAAVDGECSCSRGELGPSTPASRCGAHRRHRENTEGGCLSLCCCCSAHWATAIRQPAQRQIVQDTSQIHGVESQVGGAAASSITQHQRTVTVRDKRFLSDALLV